MAWMPIIAAGTALYGAYQSDKASDASLEGNREALGLNREAIAAQQHQFQQTRQDQQPWMQAGAGAIGQMVEGTRVPGQSEFNRGFTIGDFVKDPGYQFRMDEGQEAVETSALNRGGALSGRALKDVVRWGQDYASNEFGNAANRWNTDMTARWNRLSGLAGIGQTATNTVGNAGAQNASNIGQLYSRAGGLASEAGDIRASGYTGQANAIAGGAGNVSNLIQQQQMLDRIFPQKQSQQRFNNIPESESTPFVY